VRDLDLIATATDAPALIAAFCEAPWVVEVAARGDTKATVVGQDGFRFDLRVVPPESYGNLLQHFTGSKDHNVAMREAAVRQGLSVSEYGIAEVETGVVHAFATEEEVYGFLGYQWIPPELRENCGELEAARTGSLPDLVTLADIKGTCTRTRPGRMGMTRSRRWSRRPCAGVMPTTRSATTTPASRRPAGPAGRGATAAPRRAVPAALKGVEVNIRVNGEVDVADDELATLDWVVASVHNSFDTDPTGRVPAAMENPYVACIGHLTGRKIGRRTLRSTSSA
jgi:DNA polymerase (family 10)